MTNPLPFSESPDDYLSRRIQAVERQYLIAQGKVNHLKVQLNDLKRQEQVQKNIAQAKSLKKHITELFIRS